MSDRLKKLREARSGKKTSEIFDFDENENRNYDELSEEDYEKMKRQQIKESSFVVDDGDGDYNETGEYEWDQEAKDDNQKQNENFVSGPKDGTIQSLFSKSRRPNNSTPPTTKKVLPPKNTNIEGIIGNLSKKAQSVKTPDHSNQSFSGLGSSSSKRGFGSLSSGLGSRLSSGLGSKTRKLGSGSATPTRSTTKQPPPRDAMIGENMPEFSLKQQPVSSPSKLADESKIEIDSQPPQNDFKFEEHPRSDPPSESNLVPKTGGVDLPTEPNAVDLPNGPNSEDSANFSELSEPTSGVFSATPAASDADSTFDAPITDLPAKNSREVKIDETIRVYWYDFHIPAQFEKSKLLLMMGKTEDNQSCTCMIEGAWRDLYFKPKPEYENDLRKILAELQKYDSKARGAPRKMTNCFSDSKVPEAYYYVQYPLNANLPPSSGNTYASYNGSSLTPVESFLVSKNIMGPCWLDVTVTGSASQLVWTGFSFKTTAKEIKIVENPPKPPPMTITSLAIITLPNEDQVPQVVGINLRTYPNIPSDAHDVAMPSNSITGIRPPANDGLFPSKFKELAKERKGDQVVFHKTQDALVLWFMEMLTEIDPDVLLGHTLLSVHLSTILNRFPKNNHSMTKLGRYRQARGLNVISDWLIETISAGRLLLDLNNPYGRELLQSSCNEFSMDEICTKVLRRPRKPFNTNLLHGNFLERGAEGLLDAIECLEKDTSYVFNIAQVTQMLQLSRKLTNLAGNTWRATVRGSRSDRNDYLLMHKFKERSLLIPERAKPQKGETEKLTYQGGLVLDPVKGLTQTCVLLLDYNSLYPSIIEEFNICFTTVTCNPADVKATASVDPNAEKGVLPQILNGLIGERKKAKQLLQRSTSENEKTEHDIQQRALKLTANSMYGCLGADKSRFYSPPLAKFVTENGRQILTRTVEMANGMNLEVVYGDTDSVMLNTNQTDYAEARKIGEMFKKKVNNQFKVLEIDIEAVFREILLYAKKKYATYVMTKDLKYKLEYKGLDMRRREFSEFSKSSTVEILNLIFTLGLETTQDVIFEKVLDKLSEIANKARSGGFIEKYFVCRNQLSKDLDQYKDVKFPFVKVAKILQERGDQIHAKDVIGYIFVKNEKGESTAAPPLDIKNPELGLTIDIEHYLYHQLFTPIERLLHTFDGFDSVRLAEALGVEKQHNKSKPAIVRSVIDDTAKFYTLSDGGERFMGCEPLKICDKHNFELKSYEDITLNGVECPGCKTTLTLDQLKAELRAQTVKFINKYYESWLVCAECGSATNSVAVYAPGKCKQRHCGGKLDLAYRSRDLYFQLLYFKSLFEFPENTDPNTLAIKNSNELLLQECETYMSHFVENSGFGVINIGQYFK